MLATVAASSLRNTGRRSSYRERHPHRNRNTAKSGPRHTFKRFRKRRVVTAWRMVGRGSTLPYLIIIAILAFALPLAIACIVVFS